MSNTPSPIQNGAADHAIAGVAEPNWAALRHSANEWADMAINGLQWLRNIVDGASDAKSALENMEGNLAHCRAVNDAPDVQFAIRAASAAVPAAHAGQPVSSFDHKTASAILANRPASMPEHWSVTVDVGGQALLSIGHNWLSGAREPTEADEATIVGAAQHLLAFVGYGLPPSSYAPEGDEVSSPPVVDNQAYAAWLALERIGCGQGAGVDQEALGVVREYLMRAARMGGRGDAPAPAPAPQEIAPAIPGIRGLRPFSRANAQTSSYTGQGLEREAGK